MWNSNIRLYRINGTTNNPYQFKVDNGYSAILTKSSTLLHPRSERKLIIGSNDSKPISLVGEWSISVIKNDEVLDYNKFIKLTCKFKSVGILISIKFSLSSVTLDVAKTYGIYEFNDIGIFSELNSSIDSLVTVINESNPCLSDKNIEVAKGLITNSINRVLNSYLTKDKESSFTIFKEEK